MKYSRRNFVSILLTAAMVCGTLFSTWANPVLPLNPEKKAPVHTVAKSKLEQQVGSQLKGDETALFIVEAVGGEEGKAALKSAIAAAGISFAYEREYDTVLHGFSGKTSYQDALKIAELQETAGINAAVTYQVPSQDTRRRMARSLAEYPGDNSDKLVFAPAAWQKGYKGTGQVIAILDTGGDVEHKDFRLTDASKAKFPTKASFDSVMGTAGIAGKGRWYSDKVPYAWNYANKNDRIKAVDGDSMHGQHVAGSAAANGDITKDGVLGTAPEAQLMIMRVFAEHKPYTNDTIYVDAIDDAVKLKADSVNMSLGSTAGSIRNTGELTLKALGNASKAGTLVNIAAGNEGAFGDGYGNPSASNPDYGVVGSPAVAPLSLAVASLENDKVAFQAAVTVEGLDVKLPFNPSSQSPDKLIDKPMDFEVCGIGKPEDFNGKDLNGKVALIKRGEITFVDKINNAAAAKAVGVIIYNHESGGDEFLNMSVTGTTIPSVAVRYRDGAFLANQALGKKIILKKVTGMFDNPNAGKMSGFSSWGLSAEGDFKPEITAPGGQIYSTLNDDLYGNMSGTSMATPHVAGGVAVVKERVQRNYPSLTGEDQYRLIKNLLMSTAMPLTEPDQQAPISPRKQGAGVMNLDAAVTTNQIVVDAKTGISKINLRNVSGKFTLDMYVFNSDVNPAVFTPSVTISTDKIDEKTGEVSFNPTLITTLNPGTFTVPASGSYQLTIPVDISSNLGGLDSQMPNGYFIEGFVRLKRSADQGEIGLPFVGFHGNWDKLSVIEPSIYDTNLEEAWPFYYAMYAKMGLPFRPPTMSFTNYPYKVLKNNNAPNLNPGFTHFATSVAGIFKDDKEKINDDYYYVLGESPSFNSQKEPKNGDFRKDKLAISPNGDKKADYARFYGTFLRNYKDFKIQVYEGVPTESNLVYTNKANPDVDNGTKSYFDNDMAEPRSNSAKTWIWNGMNQKGEKVQDGVYTVSVSANPEFASSTPQTQIYAMYVDTGNPLIYKASYDDKTRLFKMDAGDAGSGIREILVQAPQGTTATSSALGLSTSSTTAVGTNPARESGMATGSAIDTSTTSMSALSVNPDNSFSVPANVELENIHITIRDWAFNEKNVTAEEILKNPDALPSEVISAQDPASMTVNFGTPRKSLGLPKTVVAKIKDADGIEKEAAIKVLWSESQPAYDGNRAGEYVFKGTLVMPDEKTINPKGIHVTLSLRVAEQKVVQPPFPGLPSEPVWVEAPTPAGGSKSSDEDNTKPAVKPEVKTLPEIKVEDQKIDSALDFTSVQNFTDIANHWAKSAIEYAVAKGYFKGVTPTEFGPDLKLTRGMLVTVLYQMTEEKTIDPSSNKAFADVKQAIWYANPAAWAASKGITAGYEDGTFRPNKPVNREEIAVLMIQYLNAKNIQLKQNPGTAFVDENSISPWAKDKVKMAQEMGLLGGRANGSFDPKASLTRAEMAQILKNLDAKKSLGQIPVPEIPKETK